MMIVVGLRPVMLFFEVLKGVVQTWMLGPRVGLPSPFTRIFLRFFLLLGFYGVSFGAPFLTIFWGPNRRKDLQKIVNQPYFIVI